MLYTDITMNKVVTVQKYIDNTLSIEDAVKHLQCSERTLYRYVASYKIHGPPGLIHGLRGRRSNNRKKKRE
jgi:transposase